MAKLKVFEDSHLVLEQDLEEGIRLTIGRGSDSDIKLEPHPGISREHAALKTENGQVRIDLVSGSGVLVHKGEVIKEHVFSEAETTVSIPPYNFTVVPSETHQPIVGEQAIEVSEEEILDDLAVVEENIENPRAQAPMPIPQDSYEEDEKTSIGSQQALDYSIKVFKDSRFLQELKIEGNSWVFGRGSQCDYIIDSKKSSRVHFNVLKIGASFYVKDLGSSNGTLLNNQQLPTNQEVELKSGDYIELAEYKFIFEIKDRKFKEKIKNISLIEEAITTSDQEDLNAIRDQAHIVSDEILRLKGSTTQAAGAQDKKNKLIRFALIGIFIIIGVFIT